MKKQYKIIVALMVLLAFSLSFGAPFTMASTVVARAGDNNDTVGNINSMLKTLGYYFASETNHYGISTKYAVMIFQRNKGFEVTGIVDQATYEALKADYATKNKETTELEPAPEPAPEQNPVPAPASPSDLDPDPIPELTPAPTPVPTPDQDSTPASVPGLTADEQMMLDLVNKERVEAGLAPLKADLNLVKSARIKSQDMITHNYFAHTSPSLGSFAGLIRTYAPSYSYVGENLAGNRAVQAAMTAFMNSAGHRKNILNPKYTHVGIGIVQGGPYGKMFTQHFGG